VHPEWLPQGYQFCSPPGMTDRLRQCVEGSAKSLKARGGHGRLVMSKVTDSL
jgi:hypothetical protein